MQREGVPGCVIRGTRVAHVGAHARGAHAEQCVFRSPIPLQNPLGVPKFCGESQAHRERGEVLSSLALWGSPRARVREPHRGMLGHTLARNHFPLVCRRWLRRRAARTMCQDRTPRLCPGSRTRTPYARGLRMEGAPHLGGSRLACVQACSSCRRPVADFAPTPRLRPELGRFIGVCARSRVVGDDCAPRSYALVVLASCVTSLGLRFLQRARPWRLFVGTPTAAADLPAWKSCVADCHDYS